MTEAVTAGSGAESTTFVTLQFVYEPRVGVLKIGRRRKSSDEQLRDFMHSIACADHVDWIVLYESRTGRSMLFSREDAYLLFAFRLAGGPRLTFSDGA